MIGGAQHLVRGIVAALAAPLIRARIHPTVVTLFGLLVATAGAGLVALGLLLPGAFVYAAGSILDALDGTVARATNKVTRLGGLLDSVIDRYGDAVALLAIAYYLGSGTGWLLALVALHGTMLTPYVRAKAESLGVQGPWPDLLERPERVALVAIGILLQALLPTQPVLLILLGLLAVLSQFTAIQRLARAAKGVAA